MAAALKSTDRLALAVQESELVPSGHGNVIDLESFALAMGLDSDAVEQLRSECFIDLAN